jgi:hypothetical protein
MRDKPYSAACRLAFHFATNGSVRGGHVYSPDTKVRVLLVERDTAMVRVLERGLRGHGFEIASTDTASEALTHIEDESIGVVVVDVYVRYLRNRLGKTVDGQPFIATVRGEGYRFNAPEGPNDPRDTHPSHSHSPHDQAI